ncbi:RICIN domain-containing protein [Bradyrhizobium oligotrophicum S58]
MDRDGAREFRAHIEHSLRRRPRDHCGKVTASLVPVADFPGVYNIRVQGGTEPKYTYLSCTSDGETVNLIAEDDLSGRQRWRFVPADLPICEYDQIIVVGGTSGGRVYLSCTSDGKQVNLIKDDDGSGRQRWQAQKIQT